VPSLRISSQLPAPIKQLSVNALFTTAAVNQAFLSSRSTWILKKEIHWIDTYGRQRFSSKKGIKLKFMEDTQINSYQTKQPFPVHELAEY